MSIAEECADKHYEFPAPAHEGAVMVLIDHLERLYSRIEELESRINELEPRICDLEDGQE